MILKKKVDAILNIFNKGEFKKVIIDINDLLKKKNTNDFLWNLKGLAFQNLSEHEKAIYCFDKSIYYNVNNLAAKNNQGNSYKSLRKFDLAENCYKKIIIKNPNYIKSLVNLGNLKTETFHFDEAINYYQLYLEKDKGTAEVYRNLGVCYQNIGKIDKAKDIFYKALKLDSNFTEIDLLLSALINYNNDSNNHLEVMLNKLNVVEFDTSKKINLYFAIAKAFDDKKNYKESFKYLKIGNTLRKELSISSDFNIDTVIESIKSYFKDFHYKKSDITQKKIIFILVYQGRVQH